MPEGTAKSDSEEGLILLSFSILTFTFFQQTKSSKFGKSVSLFNVLFHSLLASPPPTLPPTDHAHTRHVLLKRKKNEVKLDFSAVVSLRLPNFYSHSPKKVCIKYSNKHLSCFSLFSFVCTISERFFSFSEQIFTS